jgi:phosphate transport system substrate-binding protein
MRLDQKTGKCAMGRNRVVRWSAVTILSGLVFAACGGSSSSGGSSGIINGAGSTFAAPMYQQWAGEYHQSKSGVQINYQAIGSGGGIAEFTQGVVDFGATDAPMTATEQSAAQAAQGSTVVSLPMILGSVAIIYNLPGVTSLTLDGATLANIYLGKITKWNDAAIQAVNPGITLPSDAIQPVQRSDSSGTSFVLTSYLSAVSPDWTKTVGSSKAPTWPTGTGATGSSGVASAVQQTKAAIGYVEYGYATQNHIPFASLKNASGATVAPSETSTLAATSGVSFPTDPTNLTFSLVNSNNAAAYPIVTATWIIVAQKQKDASKGQSLATWLKWDLDPAHQAEVAKLGYAPLPSALASLATVAVGTVK